MKKTVKKLSLSKETLRTLDTLGEVVGGVVTQVATCPAFTCNTCLCTKTCGTSHGTCTTYFC
jgi:hypothetical protein